MRERVQGLGRVPTRPFVGAGREGLSRGAHRTCVRALWIANGQGTVMVVRQLGDDPLGVLAVLSLQLGRGAMVQAHPRTR
jgi:hypothetical protein